MRADGDKIGVSTWERCAYAYARISKTKTTGTQCKQTKITFVLDPQTAGLTDIIPGYEHMTLRRLHCQYGNAYWN